MKTKYIEKFIIGNANYIVENENCKVVLKLKYWDNFYKIEIMEGKADQKFLNEVENIGRDLLKRKSRKNFANN